MVGVIDTFCHRHADRRGIARCMACRVVVCQECATRFSGINYCAACLAKTRGTTATGSAWGARVGFALVLVTTLLASVAVLGWAVAAWAKILR